MPTMNNRGRLFGGSAFGSSPGGAMAPATAGAVLLWSRPWRLRRLRIAQRRAGRSADVVGAMRRFFRDPFGPAWWPSLSKVGCLGRWPRIPSAL